ncbi:NADH:ubiquinone oxidoreductase subunit NDUFA12 [Pelagibacterium lentulum]|uniref:NADH dehydrogenase n=1 Tax=Pelagibacterium lentulum TaxID=2029865 RepID=A0A916W1I3_9HYPH|nr:NADH:ubiquinone oxidoreductase subunit NDUFA12 [Pelagibacterium lentulum]GGA60127.1 NADH dehydrogenase [Pelagibacterium lentulum]
MKQFILEIFAWWHKQTLSTRIFTALRGVKVGEDELGNVYYKGKKDGRRWVIYNGPAEASAIPPGWHGWMHYRTDVAPSEQDYKAHTWEKPHQPNLTGTSMAYRPDGSILTPASRPRVSGDYDAWSPE